MRIIILTMKTNMTAGYTSQFMKEKLSKAFTVTIRIIMSKSVRLCINYFLYRKNFASTLTTNICFFYYSFATILLAFIFLFYTDFLLFIEFLCSHLFLPIILQLPLRLVVTERGLWLIYFAGKEN